ncbi:MAG: hypothetical protein EAX96_12305 [Candidatus Lokiarchaeota archaeon]|nr:hypothetical protein [Candidatus Lokiarchaeota archaeon]
MVEIIECKDMMGQSKNDFLNKGVAIKKKSSGGGGGGLGGMIAKAAIGAATGGSWGGDYDSLPRAKMWIEFESVAELIRVAELFGVKAINKRGKDYVFAQEGSIYYAKE